MDNNNKRTRATNLQQLEKDLLVNLVLKHEVVECKATDVASVKARTDGWKTLAEEFNSVSTVGTAREWQQLKHVCINMPHVIAHSLEYIISTVCGKKKYPLKFFAIFLATARNFYMKFHTFIPHS